MIDRRPGTPAGNGGHAEQPVHGALGQRDGRAGGDVEIGVGEQGFVHERRGVDIVERGGDLAVLGLHALQLRPGIDAEFP